MTSVLNKQYDHWKVNIKSFAKKKVKTKIYPEWLIV